MQVKDRLAMATVVEEPTVAPPSVAATVIKEGRTVTEATTSQVILDPPAEAGASGADMVMVPADDDSAPPPPAGEHDVATSTAPEPSTVVGALSVEDTEGLASCRYEDFPSIGTIDLDAPELPSNDQEMLDVAAK
jgi:hypothetical protein